MRFSCWVIYCKRLHWSKILLKFSRTTQEHSCFPHGPFIKLFSSWKALVSPHGGALVAPHGGALVAPRQETLVSPQGTFVSHGRVPRMAVKKMQVRIPWAHKRICARKFIHTDSRNQRPRYWLKVSRKITEVAPPQFLNSRSDNCT